MILFSRVRGAFGEITKREWALLSLETLGVVAGILIAFQLNEWAARRSEAARERQLLERMLEESQATVSELRERRDGMNRFAVRERAFAIELSNGRCPPAPMWQALMTLSMYPTVSVPSTVYEEIMGAGGLSRLSDRDVRAAVGEFRAEFDWVQGQNDYFRDLRQDPVKAEDPRVTYSFISTKGDPQVAAYDRGELCNDRGFRNRVIDATRNHWVIVDAQDSLTDWAIKMCVTVGNALHRKCDPPRGGPLSGEDAKLAKRFAAELRGRR